MPRVLVTPTILRNIPGDYSEILLQGGFEVVYPPEGFDTFPRENLLKVLEEQYHAPVDTEFTLEVRENDSSPPEVQICLLQCRPQSQMEEEKEVDIPDSIPASDIIFSTNGMVPCGSVKDIGWVLFVPPEGYFNLDTHGRQRLERSIGSINKLLEKDLFICVGPGRWGTSTPNLGVSIAYGDIYHTRALVELTGEGIAPDLQPSFGTHFFQDLMEAHIYPLALILGESGVTFNRDFFYTTPNRLLDFLPTADETLLASLRLLKVDDFRPGHVMDLIMNDDLGMAVAFLQPESRGVT